MRINQNMGDEVSKLTKKVQLYEKRQKSDSETMKILQLTLEKRQRDFVNLEIQTEIIMKMLSTLDRSTYNQMMETYNKHLNDQNIQKQFSNQLYSVQQADYLESENKNL